MKYKDITPQSISDITNRELVSLHWRMHQLWAQRKLKKVNRIFIKEKHSIVMAEMKRRGLKHIEHATKKAMSGLEAYLEGME